MPSRFSRQDFPTTTSARACRTDFPPTAMSRSIHRAAAFYAPEVLNEPSLLADGSAGGLCNATSEFQSRKASPRAHRKRGGEKAIGKSIKKSTAKSPYIFEPFAPPNAFWSRIFVSKVKVIARSFLARFKAIWMIWSRRSEYLRPVGSQR